MNGLMSKVCSICKTVKPLDSFVKDSSRVGKHSYLCKQCTNERSRSYYQINKQKVKNSYLMRRYGITTKELEAKLTSQDYKCQCCSNSLDGLVVDYCHTTGKVRDLLCNNCNTALGLVYENVETLRSMINYLTKHKGVD